MDGNARTTQTLTLVGLLRVQGDCLLKAAEETVGAAPTASTWAEEVCFRRRESGEERLAQRSRHSDTESPTTVLTPMFVGGPCGVGGEPVRAVCPGVRAGPGRRWCHPRRCTGEHGQRTGVVGGALRDAPRQPQGEYPHTRWLRGRSNLAPTVTRLGCYVGGGASGQGHHVLPFCAKQDTGGRRHHYQLGRRHHAAGGDCAFGGRRAQLRAAVPAGH